MSKLESQGVLVDESSRLPVLGVDGVWRLKGKTIDIAKHVRTANVRMGQSDYYLVALVSLGDRPTYGQFLLTLMSLRDKGLCDVAIFEGGEPVGHQLGVPGLSVC